LLVGQNNMHATDTLIQNQLSLLRTPSVTEFLYLVTIIFDFSIHFILVAICVAILIYLFRGKRHTILFVSAISLGALLVYLMKIYFNVPRPDGGVMEVFGKSFPSGHATVATIFFIMLMYSFDKYLSSAKRNMFNLFCLLGIVLVSFSRIYLGVHWFSDVLFGVFLGSLICYLVVYVSDRVRN